MAAHDSARMTKRYNRRNDQVALDRVKGGRAEIASKLRRECRCARPCRLSDASGLARTVLDQRAWVAQVLGLDRVGGEIGQRSDGPRRVE